jgi:hypothetical protein
MEDSNLHQPVSEESLRDISRVLADLMKTLKIISVYPDDNPLPLKLRELFMQRLTDLIHNLKGLQFGISSETIVYKREIVYKDESPDNSLASLFHNSGISEISFTPEFGFEEAAQFFNVMKTFINKQRGAEDLVALLWQSDIPGFSYKTIEDISLNIYNGEFAVRERTMEGGAAGQHLFGSHPDSDGIQYSAIFLDDDTEENTGTTRDTDAVSGAKAPDPHAYAEKQMGLKEVPDQEKLSLPDTAVILNDAYSMAASEFKQAEKINQEDAEFDGRCSTVELLREVLLQENEYSSFDETVTLIEKVQTDFLKSGKLGLAANTLSHLRETMSLLPESRAKWKERIHGALVMTGGWERLSYLPAALNNNSTIPSEEVEFYLSHFGWEAISAITDLLGELEHRGHRMAVCNHLIREGRDHVNIISKGIFDKRWFVVRNTVTILSRIGGEKAVSYLKKAVDHEDRHVRVEAVRGLCQDKDLKHIDLVAQLALDRDDLIRQMALQAILKRRGTDTLEAIVTIINDERFPTLKESDQERLVVTLSELGGEYAVDYLVSLITKIKHTSNQTKELYQKIAFRALENNQSQKAEQALLDMSRSWKKNIRTSAKETLARRRETKYGSK